MENKERNQTILQITCEMLEKMNFEVDDAFVEDVAEEENQVLVSVTVANPAGLIGFRGRNLAAIQLVLSLVVKNKLGEWVRVLLDINNYRQEQKERLTNMALNLAEKVKATGNEVVMANMSSYERRLCHMALVEIEGITSDSEGEGEDRHIVIKPIA
ncbi:KH domain-containing protein [Candidatus Shapirobacteria bacterium]|nr:KH domain-containing protein [Candidatus Shapirobacteria bacterium]